MMTALLTPFFSSNTPEEVRQKLKDEGKIPEKIYKGLTRKGIINNLPDGFKSILYPSRDKLAQLIKKTEQANAVSAKTKDDSDFFSYTSVDDDQAQNIPIKNDLDIWLEQQSSEPVIISKKAK